MSTSSTRCPPTVATKSVGIYLLIPAIRWVRSRRDDAENSDSSVVTNHSARGLQPSRAGRPTRSSPVASADWGRLMNAALVNVRDCAAGFAAGCCTGLVFAFTVGFADA